MHVTLAPKSEDELEVNHHHDYYYGCIAHAPYPIFPYLNFGHYCTVFSCSVSSDTPRYPKCFASCDACHAYHIRSSWVARRSGGTAEHLTRVVPFIQLYNDNGRLLLDSCHRKEDDLTSCRLGEETTYLHTTQTLPPATVESKVSVYL